MESTVISAKESLSPAGDEPTGASRKITEDNELIRTAAKLTRDLNTARPVIYWTDFLASLLVGYGALFATIYVSSLSIALAAGIVSIVALYRAGSFIHELTHIRRQAVPGFHFGWNSLFGVPMLLPSFMYEGVHSIHHRTKKYGTAEDPEYLPLALMKPWTVPLFVVASAFGPIALLFRYGILSPLSLVIPPLRRIVWERYSSLSINPDFRRKPVTGDERRRALVSEVAVSIWAMGLIALVATNILPIRAFAIYLVIVSGSLVLNQIRTLVAHLWENDGEQMSVTQQYLDSVNVPPPATLPAIWAPVGLRYHALHHLLPGLPYHSLGEAHRRISAELPKESNFYRADHRSLSKLVAGLIKGSGGRNLPQN